MFYNALNRKGKLDGVSETDVNAIVAIHNNMNERTWQQVLQWGTHRIVSLPGLY